MDNLCGPNQPCGRFPKFLLFSDEVKALESGRDLVELIARTNTVRPQLSLLLRIECSSN